MNFNVDIWGDIVKGIIGIVIAVFLPKRVFLCIRELLRYFFYATVRQWRIAVVAVFGGVGFYYWFPYELITRVYVTGIFCTTLAICFLVELRRFYINLAGEGALIIYGCFSSRDNDYLVVDIDAESINDILQKQCENLSLSNSAFRAKLPALKFVVLPQFLPLLFGYRGTKKFISKFILSNKHISSLYFVRNISDQKLTTLLAFRQENFANPELMREIQNLLNSISKDNKFGVNGVAEISLKLYALVFSQIFLDVLLVNKQYGNVQTMLDESSRLLADVKDLFSVNQAETPGAIQFFNIWKSYIERYRAILLLDQGEFRGAVNYIISSISLNPYYPYFNYDSFRDNYIRRYGIELSYSIQEAADELKEPKDVDFDTARDDISKNIVSKDAEFSYKILLEIIHRDEKKLTHRQVETELIRISHADSATKLAAAEVLKHLPDGSEKVNEIYLGRIDKAVEFLESIVNQDKGFSLMHAKIGALLLMKALQNGSDEDMLVAAERWTLGMHFLTELGLNSKSATSTPGNI
ncbi:MAG: hypothetical protein JNL72_11265 [Flavipsychrobacter sp.]|nr:hypothetical protein [Flavipsychrobacter sp.]